MARRKLPSSTNDRTPPHLEADRARAGTHLAKAAIDGHRQGRWFSRAFDASWVESPAMAKTNLLNTKMT
jgi:hypothetical protein